VDDIVTLVLPLRNRDSWRIERLVGSLRSHGADPRVLIIDYGSDRPFAKQYEEIAAELGLEYERMEAEGTPWNKCRAINRGARLANSGFVCTADIDVYFKTDPIRYCKERWSEREMFHIRSFWLPRGGGEDRAVEAGEGTPGMFQFVDRTAYEESGGYDERIVYWGMEDLDWPMRLETLGYKMLWLPEPHRIFHQWHQPSESGRLRPDMASYQTMRYCIENLMVPVIRQDWGKPISRDDRPILAMMGSRTPEVVRVGKNALMHYGNLGIILDTKGADHFIKLDLGPRLVKRPLSRFSGIAKTLLRPITAAVSLDCDEKTNRNFDYLYAMLPALSANGLADYFISSDLSEVFLYWSR
jgi:hypothetical protein